MNRIGFILTPLVALALASSMLSVDQRQFGVVCARPDQERHHRARLHVSCRRSQNVSCIDKRLLTLKAATPNRR